MKARVVDPWIPWYCHASCCNFPLLISVTEYSVNMTTQVSATNGSHSHGPTTINATCVFVYNEILQSVGPQRLDRHDTIDICDSCSTRCWVYALKNICDRKLYYQHIALSFRIVNAGFSRLPLRTQ